MTWLNVVLYAYAALVLVGGVFGYVKVQSVVSLAMSAAAAVFIVAGVIVSKTNRSLGYGVCGAVAAILAAFFAYRVFNGSIMPGVPALILSVAALAALVFSHFSSK
ncbi:MAG: TMEM14 family protein [Armatimonadota bacterium]|nr:TMEM14 family protein [Armatimonadota bacterium]